MANISLIPFKMKVVITWKRFQPELNIDLG